MARLPIGNPPLSEKHTQTIKTLIILKLANHLHGDTIVKLTVEKLREIIKEEMENFLAEEKREHGVYDSRKEAEEHIAKAGDTTMKVKEIEKDGKTLFKVVEPE